MEKREHIHKRHNVSLLMYHIVCVAKYRKCIFDDAVENTIKDVCLEIEKRYEIGFIEIGSDKDHIHFLVWSVPMNSPKQIVQKIKSIVAIETLKRHPEIKKVLWWWSFRTDWYYINTVWWYGNVDAVMKYVQQQWGVWYKSLHSNVKQLSLFS
jgi:putative transposase